MDAPSFGTCRRIDFCFVPVDDCDLIGACARWEDCGQVKVVVKVESLDEMLLIQVCVCVRAQCTLCV